VELLAKAGLPIEMLGRPAPAWTLLEAYGDVTSLSELEGRVVVLDFWATWCPWCIKSFPAIRDLLRDYEEQGLVVVGVTAPASTVYAHRFDLDDDLESTGERPKPVARLARGEPDPDAEIPLLTEDEYRAVERETLPVFVANHAMTWPVVLIDAEDPGRKFALSGWPHAVVIDRAGRVRYFKSGALLRDRPEAVAAFRKVLEDLLAEPPPAADE
jgi:peroxiredoxin